MSIYQDELNQIRRKSKQVYLKHGIKPFLGDSTWNGDNGDEYIQGFQIFRLFDIDDIICDDVADE